jgi:hypothetical protein
MHTVDLRRREILKSLGAGAAALGAGGMCGTRIFGQSSGGKVNKLTAKGGAVDVHHHHQPPGLAGGDAARGKADRPGLPNSPLNKWTNSVSP